MKSNRRGYYQSPAERHINKYDCRGDYQSPVGISLISLIITIIVIIILAAIVIFTGLNTPDRANFAKFVSEFSDFRIAVNSDYMEKMKNHSLQQETRSKAQTYYEISKGEKIDMDVTPVAYGMLDELEIVTEPGELLGNEYYLITEDKNVDKWNKNKVYYESSEKHFVTDEGDVFILPGYKTVEDGVEKWWINEKIYYLGTGEKCKVTFNHNHGLISKKETVTMYNGTYMNLPVPERNGYAFIGWYTEKDGGVEIKEGDAIPEDGYKLYAHWTPVEGLYVMLTDKGTLVFSKEKRYEVGMPYGTETIKYDYGDINGGTRKWGEQAEIITKAVIEDEIAPTTMDSWFRSCANLTEIDGMEKIDTSNVKKMSSLFWGCKAIEEINVSHFSTGNVTAMENLFRECSSVTTLDLKNFDTSNVTTMANMFQGCSKATVIDVSSFNTSNVTNMQTMFHYCSSVTNLDIKNFDTRNVTSMEYMFYYCSSLESIDVGGFDTGKVEKMNNMFMRCEKVSILDVSHFNTSNVTTMRNMFGGCTNLATLDVSNFDTKNVTNMAFMFIACYAIEELNVSKFNTENVEDMTEMFNGCWSLKSLDVSNFDTRNVKNLSYMFRYCKLVSTFDLSKFDTSKVENMTEMFRYCNNVQTIIVSDKFTTSMIDEEKSTNMFGSCYKLAGGAGTTFDSSQVDIAYARIDGTNGLPGYFTDIKDK